METYDCSPPRTTPSPLLLAPEDKDYMDKVDLNGQDGFIWLIRHPKSNPKLIGYIFVTAPKFKMSHQKDGNTLLNTFQEENIEGF